jgi:hypothetical protein
MVTKSIVNALAPVPKVCVMVWAEQIVERMAKKRAERMRLRITFSA